MRQLVISKKLTREEIAILNWMRQQAAKGVLEHTLPEVMVGARLSRGRAGEHLGALQGRALIGSRSRGGKIREVRYFYLAELVAVAKRRWKP